MQELLKKLRLKVDELQVLSGLNDPPRQETYVICSFESYAIIV